MFPYPDKSLSTDERIRDLLTRMNADEKIGQLCKFSCRFWHGGDLE